MERKQKHIKTSVTALFLTHTSHFPHTNLHKMLLFWVGGGTGTNTLSDFQVSNLVLQHGEFGNTKEHRL